MRRRAFIALLGGAAMARPLAARAQQPATLPTIGFLSSRPADETREFAAAFRQGLAEAGFVDGRNIMIEYRWADGHYDRLPALAADLVNHQVAVIVTSGGPVSALAARAATSNIPIVFTGGSDPVAMGLVASLNRPGGNVTGVLNVAAELTAKRLEILHELMPAGTDSIAMLRNPAFSEAASQVKELEVAARAIGLRFRLANARDEREAANALAELSQDRPAGLLVANDPAFASRRHELAALIARLRIPAIYAQRQYVEAGGLMSYGANFADLYRQIGVYAGRILKGDKPGELPVMRPTLFELVINLKTAKALGLEIPATLIARADEVIE
jgi:putative tryptophan/tyrosine transport system substrate-binding protein